MLSMGVVLTLTNDTNEGDAMSNSQRTVELIADIKGRIDQLQIWFAAKPYGWRERATAGQLQQWEDRAREESYLIDRLEMLQG